MKSSITLQQSSDSRRPEFATVKPLGGQRVGPGLAVIQRVQSILVTIYLLELIGATVVTALGWAACRILQIDWSPSAPLWFAGYLLVYNLDRLYSDPADQINIPIRSSKTEELRRARVGLASLSAVTLLVWPLLTGRWWLMLPLAIAATVLQFYSRPVPGVGFRLKDLPYVKSLLPPVAIAGILVIWPGVENGRGLQLEECLVFVWCLLALTINSLLFDYRDIKGDSVIGTQTIPVRLGPRNTICLLIGLVVALVGVSAWMATRSLVSPLMAVLLAGASAGLLVSVIGRSGPMTVSVLADLLLTTPAVVEIFA
jgi:4-hydroxybenzoate polyprenyltransferase